MSNPITPNDIADRLQGLVETAFPGEEIYRDLVEEGFSRPSTLIVYEGGSADPGYGSNIVEMQDRFTLTTFVKVDPYHNSHLAGLHIRQMKLVGLFVPGYIKVRDRAPKVVSIERGGGYDYDTVTVTLSYALDRNDFLNIPQQPAMEQLHLNEEVKTYG